MKLQNTTTVCKEANTESQTLDENNLGAVASKAQDQHLQMDSKGLNLEGILEGASANSGLPNEQLNIEVLEAASKDKSKWTATLDRNTDRLRQKNESESLNCLTGAKKALKFEASDVAGQLVKQSVIPAAD